MATTKKTDPGKKKPQKGQPIDYRRATPTEQTKSGLINLVGSAASVPSLGLGGMADATYDTLTGGPVRRFRGALGSMTQNLTDRLAGVPEQDQEKVPDQTPPMPIANAAYTGVRDLISRGRNAVVDPRAITDVGDEASFWLGQLLGLRGVGRVFDAPTNDVLARTLRPRPRNLYTGPRTENIGKPAPAAEPLLSGTTEAPVAAQAPAQYGLGRSGLINFLRSNPQTLGAHPDAGGALPVNPYDPATMLESVMRKSRDWDVNAHASPAGGSPLYRPGQTVKLKNGKTVTIHSVEPDEQLGGWMYSYTVPGGSHVQGTFEEAIAGPAEASVSSASPAPIPNTPSLTLPGGQSILTPFQRYMIGRYSDVNPESPAAESEKVLNAVRNKRFQERVPSLIEHAAGAYTGDSDPRLFNRLMAEWYKPEVVNTAAFPDKATRTALQYERNVNRLLEPGRDPIDSGPGQFKGQMRNALFQLMAENPRRIPNSNYFRVIEPGTDAGSLGIWRHDFANALGGVSLNVPEIAHKYGASPEAEQIALRAVLAHELRHGEDSRRYGMKNLDWGRISQSVPTELNAYASELLRLLGEYDNAPHPRLMGRIAGLGREAYDGLKMYTGVSNDEGGVPSNGILNVGLRRKALTRLGPRIDEMLGTNLNNAESVFQRRRASVPADVQEHASGPIDFKNQQEKDVYNAVERKKYQLGQQPAEAERAQLADVENEIARLSPIERNQATSYLTPAGVDEDAMARYTETVHKLEQLMTERNRLEEVIAQKSESMDKWTAQNLDELDAYAEGKGLPDEVLMHASIPPTFQTADLDKFNKAYEFLTGLQNGTTPEGQLYQKAQKLGPNSMKLSDDERVKVKQIEQQKRDAFGDYKRLWDDFTAAKGAFDPATKQWSGLTFTDEAPKPEAEVMPTAAPEAPAAEAPKPAKVAKPKTPKPAPKPSLPPDARGAYNLVVADPDETLRTVMSVGNSAGLKTLKREAAKHEGTIARWIEDENGDVVAQWDPKTGEMRDLKVSELKKNSEAKASGEARARVENENDKARAPQPMGPTLDDQTPGNHARVEKLNAKQLKEKEDKTASLIQKASIKVGWADAVQNGKDAAWSKGMTSWYTFVNNALATAPHDPVPIKRPDGTTYQQLSYKADRFRPSKLTDSAWNSVLTALRNSPQAGRSFVLVNAADGPRFVVLSPEQRAKELPAVTEPAPEPKPAPPAKLSPPPEPKPPKPPNTTAFKYRPESQDLIVTFGGARDYRVEGVDAATAKAYGEAPSQSQFYNEHFKNKPGYTIYRIEPDGKEVMVQSGHMDEEL